MGESDTREAWVEMPSPAERKATMETGGPYDFGFRTAMGGLLMAHPEEPPGCISVVTQE